MNSKTTTPDPNDADRELRRGLLAAAQRFAAGACEDDSDDADLVEVMTACHAIAQEQGDSRP